jgi:uracil-DNA glycosylase family 4
MISVYPLMPALRNFGKRRGSERNCNLYKRGTQAVFGDGPGKAKVMVAGEQPGNQENLQGHPFVGPAGKLLESALEKVSQRI